MSKTILIVDDEKEIRDLLSFNLKQEGYKIKTAKNGEDALVKAETHLPDLMILDIMLPGLNGLEVLKQIKNNDKTSSVAVIMLSAKGEESDIVLGLELGAQDYISKPFSIRILTARIKSVFRNRDSIQNKDKENLTIHNIQIFPGRHKVLLNGKTLDLTFSEFKLLHYFASKPGWVFTRKQIVDTLRGENTAITERAIDVMIAGLRKKLASQSNIIETVRGIGYRVKE